MSRRKAALRRLQQAWSTARHRHWDLQGGPAPVLLWSMRHPWIVTIAVAVVLALVLGATFGVPPVSPLVLVALLVAPIPWWLRGERRLHDRWRTNRGD